MRVIAILFLYGLALGWASAQGTVHLANYVPWYDPPIDAPFYDTRGVPLAGPGYVAQLYTGATASSLTPAGTPTPFTTDGYFADEFVTVATAGGGGQVWVQVRAWDATCASTYEQALAAGCWIGLSNELFLPRTGDPTQFPPTLPAYLVGLKFIGVPEPSSGALLLLGAGLLAVFKRRRL